MKKTKDIIEKKIIEISSKEEAAEIRQVATGRRFFKIGDRVIDICRQEIDRYNYDNSNFLVKLLQKSKYENKKNKYRLETRIKCYIRAVAAQILRDEENEGKEFDDMQLTSEVRNYLLETVKRYEKEHRSKIIDIKTKEKKEA